MTMTNEQRRNYLSTARMEAVQWAQRAELDSTTTHNDEAIEMAQMWANVAQALKVGDAVADAVSYSHERV